MLEPTSGMAASTSRNQADSHAAIRKVAEKLEAQFLAEMLKSAGLGKTGGEFSGGEGEDQFQSFLVSAQAEKMVERGGIGLAEVIFESLKGRSQ